MTRTNCSSSKRIRVIVPVTTEMWNQIIQEELEKYREQNTVLEIVSLKKGIESIETAYDEAWAVPFTLEEAIKAEKDGCHGIIIYCTADPGLQAAKEAVKIPVVGLGEASFYMASLLGRKFCILSAGPEAPPNVSPEMDNLKVYGLAEKCVGLLSLGVTVLDLEIQKEKVKERLIELGQEMIKRGADVIVLGCGSILGVDEEVSKILGIPVVVPARAALKLCETLINIGLAQSKRAFPSPERKRITL